MINNYYSDPDPPQTEKDNDISSDEVPSEHDDSNVSLDNLCKIPVATSTLPSSAVPAFVPG